MEFKFKVGKHNLEADVDFHAEKDGIGWYEYGSITAYDDSEYPEIDEVCDCCIIRTGRCDKPENAPACANSVHKILDKDKNIIGYEWRHERKINAEISDAVYDAIEEYITENGMEFIREEREQMRIEDSRYDNDYYY